MDNKPLGKAVDGSVLSFTYLGEVYMAGIRPNGEFLGYYSKSNSAHFINAYFDAMPSPPMSNWDKTMNRIEGGVQFLIGSIGALGSAAFTGATSETGIGLYVGYAALGYTTDQAQTGLSQAISGYKTSTLFQSSLAGLGATPSQVQAIDIFTNYLLGAKMGSMMSSSPIVKPVSTLPNSPQSMDDLAFGLGSNLDEFSSAMGLKNYRQFTSGGFKPEEIEAAIKNVNNNLHFNLTDFTRGRYLKYAANPTKPTLNNITNWELHTIYNTPGALDRTTFYKFINGNYQIVPKPF